MNISMQPSAYDLKAFYNTSVGQMMSHILAERINAIWPDVKNLDILGTGYTVPYMNELSAEASLAVIHMPVKQGIHPWPQTDKNKATLAESGRLPFENNAFDRAIMIHGLEFFYDVQGNLEELWRILRPNGRLLVIVPNRTALWAQADWTPLGRGRPYTARQLSSTLMESRFVVERSEQALYVPPLTWPVFLKSASFLEKYSRYLWPLGGVHIVEASKQLYAPIRKDSSGSKVAVKDIIGLQPAPVPQGM